MTHALAKWFASYWTVVLVSVALSLALNQAAAWWRAQNVRGRAERDRREVVYRDLRGRLLTHCETLRQALIAPIDAGRWQRLNDELLARAKDPDVVAGLETGYDAFLAAVAAESRAIAALRRNEANADRERAKRLAVESVADVLIAYAPFLRIVGDPKGARDFEAMARRSYAPAGQGGKSRS